MKEDRQLRLRKELQAYYNAGIQLMLDGHPSCPSEIAKVCSIAEDNSYMRDYIHNDQDQLQTIGFDRVKDIL